MRRHFREAAARRGFRIPPRRRQPSNGWPTWRPNSSGPPGPSPERRATCTCGARGRHPRPGPPAELPARAVRGDMVWFAFCDLCEATTGVSDYLALAERFGTLVLDGPPADRGLRGRKAAVREPRRRRLRPGHPGRPRRRRPPDHPRRATP
ncbi:AFG1/ZapE family ATPase [Streptomyces roseus]|uniref:AFG1/ZapE family ATPase n=1 Tax=Streptomyces roseus TaxID=66430 RepID=UPI00382ECD62